jgi:chromosome partitioning protein
MPVILTFAHQKGGVGKSTLSLNIASYYAREGVNCGIVDTDVQGSITDTFESYADENGLLGGLRLIRREDFNKFEDLLSLTEFDLLVIDTPPFLTTTLTEIFPISNFVIIPMRPAINDFFALNRTKQFVQDFLKINPSVKTGIVLNMTVQGSNFSDQIRKELEDTEIRVLDTEIVHRVEFMRYLLYAPNIFESKDPKAKKEIADLGDEIYSMIQE